MVYINTGTVCTKLQQLKLGNPQLHRNMMQPEFLNSFSPLYNTISSFNSTEEMGMEINCLFDDLEFPSGIFSPSAFLSSNFIDWHSWDVEVEHLFKLPEGDFEFDAEAPDEYLSYEADEMSLNSLTSQKYSSCSVSSPSRNDEDNDFSLFHLLKAYGEATEKKQIALMEVIQRCISDMASPVGGTMERLSFNLFNVNKPQYSYLKQESQVNFGVAYKTFYQLFPYGRLAHIAANSAILGALPAESKTIYIVDFDIVDGVQWAPLIENCGRLKKEVTLISVKWDDNDSECTFSQCNAENTRKRLMSHARSVGAVLKLQVVEIEDLVSEIKKINKRSTRTQWFAFNCMVSLPHMIRDRSKAKVLEFLRVAKDVLGDSTNSTNKGIITFGDGEADMTSTKFSNYSSFFDAQLAHYQALLQSVEWTLSDRLANAKLALECLFLAPRISSHQWHQKSEDMNEFKDIIGALGLNGLELSKSTLMEANELVRGGGANSYILRMGLNVNEIVLEWRGTPLVKLSTWSS